jgi:hypothetical protein
MRSIATTTIALLPSLALAQPLLQPKPAGPGGSCPLSAHRQAADLCPFQGPLPLSCRRRVMMQPLRRPTFVLVGMGEASCHASDSPL